MPNFPRFVATPRVPALAAFLSLAMLLVSCIGPGQELSSASDFQVTLFDGSSFRLSDEAGQRAVVLNFWYPTCPPCREEMPSFEAAWLRLQADAANIKFLGFFVPQGFDSEQDARDFVAELGLTYGFATDISAQVAKMFQIEVYPTTVFIDVSGRVFKTQISVLDEEKIISIVREMSGG